MTKFSKLGQVAARSDGGTMPFGTAHSPDPNPREVSAGSCVRELYWEAKAD